MKNSLTIDFAFPGNLATPTGGYAYDRRAMAALAALGHDVRALSLGSGFPNPSKGDLAIAAQRLKNRASDALIVDGLAFGAFPRTLAANLTPRAIALVHHPLFLETGLEDSKKQFLRASEQAALDEAAAVVTTSAMTAALVAEAFGLVDSKIFVAEPGVDPSPRCAQSPCSTLQMLAVGAISPRKGYDDLIRALAGLEGDWHMRIVGAVDIAPDIHASLLELIDLFSLRTRVEFVGALSEEALAEAYARADIFVCASHYEGYGMALAEAVACGLPIVVTNEAAQTGAVPADAIMLTPAGDPAAQRIALKTILKNADLRARLSAASRAASNMQPRWANTAQALMNAIDFARKHEKEA